MMIFCKDMKKNCKSPFESKKPDAVGYEHHAWRVAGRMFTCLSSAQHDVYAKTSDLETVSKPIDAGAAFNAPCFYRHWITLPRNLDDVEHKRRIDTSDDTIRAGLTKKLHVTLPARDEV